MTATSCSTDGLLSSISEQPGDPDFISVSEMKILARLTLNVYLRRELAGDGNVCDHDHEGHNCSH